MYGDQPLKESKMAKTRKWLECTSCDAMFAVRHTMDEKFYKAEFCPFCGDELDVEDELEIDDEYEE